MENDKKKDLWRHFHKQKNSNQNDIRIICAKCSNMLKFWVWIKTEICLKAIIQLRLIVWMFDKIDTKFQTNFPSDCRNGTSIRKTRFNLEPDLMFKINKNPLAHTQIPNVKSNNPYIENPGYNTFI